MSIPWFHHDTDSRKNKKIRRLLRTHGVMGLGIWWSLLEELMLADKSGFVITADEFWLEDFADDLKISDHRILVRVLDTLAELNLIDRQLWHEHMLMCHGIAERGDAYIKRKAQNAEYKRNSREEARNVSADISEVSSESVLSQRPRDRSRDRVDPDSDPETENREEEKKEINICTSADFEIFEPFRIVWNDNAPSHWRRYKKLDGAIAESLKRFTKKYKAESLEIFIQGLQYLSHDKFYSSQKVDWSLCQYLTNDKPFKYACEYRQNQDCDRHEDKNSTESWYNALQEISL